MSSVDDPQWAAAFEDVYTTELFGDAPFLGTIGNHDTSILSPAAAQVQLNYSTLHPRWHMPARNFERTFASGNSSVQVVVFDSMPLTDRWFYSGASGVSLCAPVETSFIWPGEPSQICDFSSGTTFVAGDSVADDTAHNAVINPGVTRANGFEGPNLFNASRFQCGFDFAAGTIAGPANCKVWPKQLRRAMPLVFDANAVCIGRTGSVRHTCSPRCRVGEHHIDVRGRPRAQVHVSGDSWLACWSIRRCMLISSASQVTLTHMPLLSAQQRQMPLYHDAMAALRALGVAAPQIAFNGHDHINAILVDPNYRKEFWTSGAGGISDFGRAGVYPPAGYALAGGQHLTELINKSYSPYPPRRGVAAYNPDVNRTQFWSEFNGFVLCTANAAALSCSVHLVNCSAVATTGSCGPQPYMGAVFTRRYGPKHAKKA